MRRVPTLLVASAADRLLPSMAEAARLHGVLPDARRVTLPDSGHTALLEEGVALAAIMARAGFLPKGRPYAVTAAATAADGSATVSNGSAAGSAGDSHGNSATVSTLANRSAATTPVQPVPDLQRAAATVSSTAMVAVPNASASSAADRCASRARKMCALLQVHGLRKVTRVPSIILVRGTQRHTRGASLQQQCSCLDHAAGRCPSVQRVGSQCARRGHQPHGRAPGAALERQRLVARHCRAGAFVGDYTCGGSQHIPVVRAASSLSRVGCLGYTAPRSAHHGMGCSKIPETNIK